MSTATDWTTEHFIGGEVPLDFANTVYRRTPELGADLFNNVEALTTWLGRVELLPTSVAPADPAAALAQARALRQLFWGVFDAQIAGEQLPQGALADLLDVARRGAEDLVTRADGVVAARSADGALAVLALRALALVLNPPARPVRSCDRCGWFFTDTSRGRRRRWCSMRTCGNQAKVERFRSAQS